MEWLNIFVEELGGGLEAVVIIALGFALYKERQKTDKLQERFVSISLSTQDALHALTNVLRDRG